MADHPVTDGERRLGRYVLRARVASVTAPEAAGTALWHGHDEVLDREVAVRVLDDRDPRVPTFLAAARAAALVEDRRLLRVLDVLDRAELDGAPVVAVVSEWADGPTLAELAAQGPLHPRAASQVATEVARAVAAGLDADVSHGRLRPSSVIVSDTGGGPGSEDVRVRGLAVDAALFGPLDAADHADRRTVDVDGLGSLLYLLLTGTWPGAPIPGIAPAPRAGDRVIAPGDVRASVPPAIGEVVARSVRAIERPRGTAPIGDAAQFAQALGIARDQAVPAVPITSRAPRAGRARAGGQRLLGVLVAVVAVVALAFIGWRLAASGSAPVAEGGAVADANGPGILTSSVAPEASATAGPESVLPVIGARSFDPLGDDDGNGKPDGKKGRENDETAPLVADGDETTAWTSATYRSADADGKGGVGIVLDLGEAKPVRAADLRFTDTGAAVEVRVADEVLKDPQLWSLVAQASAGTPRITLRAPRPVTGRYVLLWFPEIPNVAGSSSRFQVSLGEARILG